MVCRRAIRRAAAGVLLAVWLLAAGCIRGPAQPENRDARPVPADAIAAEAVTEATVVRAVDGDTLVVAFVSGAPLPSERVRLIGVNTPESTTRVEPFGKEAAAFTAGELTDKTVWLTRDISDTDRYGRALRFVWLVPPPAEPTDADVYASMFNAILVRQGYANAATFPPDVRHADLFRALEQEARTASRGLWAPEFADVTPPTAGPGSGGLRYDPAGPDRDCGDFAGQAEAQAFFLAAGGPAADPHGLDGDRDGLACETLP